MTSDPSAAPADQGAAAPGPRATTGVDPGLAARVRAWAHDDPDPRTADEALALLARATSGQPTADAAEAAEELADRFSRLLTFGTAGLRGRLGAGPNRMNRAVVIRAAAALCAYLEGAVGAAPRVVVGYDARHRSTDFARDTAAVVTAAGGTALLLPAPTPTPVLAHAVRRLSADAGVMVTASHNPATDNGYKVYLGGRVATGPAEGVQLDPPADAAVAERMAALPRVADVPRASGGWQVLDDGVGPAYLECVTRRLGDRRRSLRVVLTPLHGVGGALAAAALAGTGFTDVHPVRAQWEPDADFPTAPRPNPEEAGALDLALTTAREVGADLVLALDPDADRCAVAVPASGSWRRLTGDEVGALLGARAAERIARAGSPGVLVSSVVSSRLLARIARDHGVRHVTTLTGFKWIARVPGLAFGYEEALGYCVDPDTVRDKDGIAAALEVAALADDLASAGRTLLDELDDLACRYGVHVTAQVTASVDDAARRSELMSRLRRKAPRSLAGSSVSRVVDLASGSAALPPTDAVLWTSEAGDRVVVRPSGTEPIVKCYLEVVRAVADDDLRGAQRAAAARLESLRADVAQLLEA